MTYIDIKYDKADRLYTVGLVTEDTWMPLQDCKTKAEACRFINYLNGGEGRPMWGE